MKVTARGAKVATIEGDETFSTALTAVAFASPEVLPVLDIVGSGWPEDPMERNPMDRLYEYCEAKGIVLSLEE